MVDGEAWFETRPSFVKDKLWIGGGGWRGLRGSGLLVLCQAD